MDIGKYFTGPSKAGCALRLLLRGSGQVIFLDSSLAGLCNFLALGWGAYSGGTNASVAIGALLGTMTATLIAVLVRADKDKLGKGLYGFNGMLVGAVIPTFVAASPLMWGLLFVATAVSTLVTLAVENLLRGAQIPGLTFPFVLTSWLVLLAVPGLSGFALIEPVGGVSANGQGLAVLTDAAFILRASLVSVSQVFFINDPISGALILLGLALHSRWCAGLAAGGAVLGVVAALGMGADPAMVGQGLWAYSAVLTAPAVGCIFMQPSLRTIGYAALAALFTIIVQGATATATQVAGIAPLTFPFVLTTWIFLVARARGSAAA